MTRFAPLTILAALGGRAQWRWWLAPAVWLTVGLISRVIIARDGVGYSTSAAAVLPMAVTLSLVLVWGWGSRFAVSLGHRRAHVLPVMVVGSFALVWGCYLLEMVARRLEILAGGVRVFHHSAPGGKFHSEEFFDIFQAFLLAMATVPAIAVACVIVCALRWGIGGGALAAVGAVVLLGGPFWLWVPQWPTRAYYVAVAALLATVTWRAFQRAPV